MSMGSYWIYSLKNLSEWNAHFFLWVGSLIVMNFFEWWKVSEFFSPYVGIESLSKCPSESQIFCLGTALTVSYFWLPLVNILELIEVSNQWNTCCLWWLDTRQILMQKGECCLVPLVWCCSGRHPDTPEKKNEIDQTTITQQNFFFSFQGKMFFKFWKKKCDLSTKKFTESFSYTHVIYKFFVYNLNSHAITWM